MKRFSLCKIVGDGKSLATAFRPAIADVAGYTMRAVIAVHPLGHPQEGKPVYEWCLANVSGDKFDSVEGADIDLLPDIALDVKVSDIDAQTKAAMSGKLSARGIDTTFVETSYKYLNVILALGKLHEPAFDEKLFDGTVNG